MASMALGHGGEEPLASNLSILVVDDCPADTQLVRAYLDRVGQSTTVESTSALTDALSLLSSGRFDLALVDHDLGAATGLDLIAMARRRGVDCPLILVTGTVSAEVERMALDCGASDFVAKQDLQPRILERVIHYNLHRAADRWRDAQHKHRLEAVIEGSNDGIWDWNLSNGSIFVSNRFRQLIGAESAEAQVGLEEWMLQIHEDDRERVETALRDCAVGHSMQVELEYRVRPNANGVRWLSLRGGARRSPSGRLERVAGSQTDITEQKSREEDARKRSERDPLTGLANRSKLHQRVDDSLRRVGREGGGFALLYIDLDGFKSINDRFGHQAGDEVLRVVGMRLRAGVARRDCVARVGGDEFVLVLEGCTNQRDAEAVAARVQASIMEPIELKGTKVSISASCGVRTVDRCGVIEELLEDADRAMFSAKERKDTVRACNG